MPQEHKNDDAAPGDRLAAAIEREFAMLHRRLDVLDRRLEQRFGEVRIKQEEDLMLVKAMSCQLRGRVERAERRGSRPW
jgi:hypothetical protein